MINIVTKHAHIIYLLIQLQILVFQIVQIKQCMHNQKKVHIFVLNSAIQIFIMKIIFAYNNVKIIIL